MKQIVLAFCLCFCAISPGEYLGKSFGPTAAFDGVF
jgi:hypothetical protein